METLDAHYWDARYTENRTGWDVGEPTTPLRTFIDGLGDRDLRILVPGAGNAWEVEYLARQGFRDVHLLDWAPTAIDRFRARVPSFPTDHLHVGDFFQHTDTYDLLLEQTFFCALDPSLRPRYAKHAARLLAPSGRLAGVLFDDPLNTDHPPFGGSIDEYRRLFAPHFDINTLAPCTNSIPPRTGREAFIDLTVRHA